MNENARAYATRLIEAGMPEAQAWQIAEKSVADTAGSKPVAPSKSGSVTKAPTKPKKLDVDYLAGQVPSWVQEIVETQLAIEREDARKAGSLGFMARALVLATLPYRDQKHPDGSPKESFTRVNGDFRLRIVAGYQGGIPFGIYPRLLMSWVTTEAVRKQSPVIELGDSLRVFLREVLDLRSSSGGSRGTATRVTEQMKRLFGSLVTAQFDSVKEKRGFSLNNILIAERLELGDALDALWQPQDSGEAGAWQSRVRLTNTFFQECISNPVPIDLRAYKALRASPLAMDLYTWLTYRMSYVESRSRPIRWEALLLQFGSGIGASAGDDNAIRRAVYNFKRDFLKALEMVQMIYPEAKFEVTNNGLVLLPSRPHIPVQQTLLF